MASENSAGSTSFATSNELACPENSKTSADSRMSGSMKSPQAPQLPRPRMPLSQRAKIFIPFDPLKGYQEALREKEREAEAAHYERINLEDAP